MAGRDDLARELHPNLAPWAVWLYDVAAYYGLNPRVTSTFRSYAHQQQLRRRWDGYRAQGYSPAEIGRRFGLWTPAQPGRSLHNYRHAFDLVVDRPDFVGAVWRHVGGYWAGPGDPVHFATVRTVDDLFPR